MIDKNGVLYFLVKS